MTDQLIAALPGILTVLVVFVAVPLNWYVTWLLWRLHRLDPEGRSLRVMGILSACVSVIVSVFAVVFINNGISPPPLNLWQTMVLTRGALCVLSVVTPILFLRWYRGR